MFLLEFDEDMNMAMNIEEEETKFKKISNKALKTESNPLFRRMHEETSLLNSYLEDKINKFKDLFDKDLKSLDNTVKYLESIALSHNCKCSEIIDSLPGWKCLDCSELDSIYCSNCYIKSKNLHKGHKIHYLPKSEKTTGRCDCGDSNNLKVFCPEHKGSFKDMKEIDEFIEKSFQADILSKLNSFFEDLFLKFSQYLILGEQCTFFRWDILQFGTFTEDEKIDISLLKENFCAVFQNFLTFLYTITNKSMGMLYLVSKYFLNNYLSKNPEEKFKICHICAKLENKKIEIIKENEKESESVNKHDCKCPFLRLLLSNWRDKVKPKKESQNRKLLLLFTHNIFFKECFSLIYFFISKEILFNSNEDIMHERSAFLSENDLYLIGTQTDIIESAYTNFYEYLKEILNKPIMKEANGALNLNITKKIMEYFKVINEDLNNFLRPKMRELISSKIKNNLIIIFLNIVCLIHNQCEYKSIYPHPEFQEKPFPIYFLNWVVILQKIVYKIFLCYNYENIDAVKILFDCLIKKIINQKEEQIKQLNENEYSFHLSLYRFFGIFVNYFCFNYAIKNNKSLFDGIEFIKSKLFNSKEEMEKCIDIVISDYFRMFGFITGCRNGYFNYYEYLDSYNELYFNELIFIKTDFTLLKYLIALSEQKFSLEKMLKFSNIENIYAFFSKIFIEKSADKNTKVEEDEKKHILQWIRFFQIIICIMKNDSTHFSTILTSYNDVASSKTKSELFDTISKNKNLMDDLENNLKEKLVLTFISNGNSLDLKEIKNLVDDYYFDIFKQKQFDEILNDLTDNKIDNKNKKIYSLKDSSLKYLDLNYYFSPVEISKAELYINDFKKDMFKLFNSYYFKSSMLAYDLNNKVFENILLNKENTELILEILSQLLPKLDKDIENNKSFIKPIKEAFLPIILNYITILGTINSKNFIKFKLDNKNIFMEINDILNTALKNNKNNEIFDNDLSENVLNTISQLNKYEIINANIKGDLNKLDDFDYNINYNVEDKNIIEKNNNEANSEGNNLKKKKSNKLKEKYKNLIKQKRNNFMENNKDNKGITDIIESNNESNINEEKDKDKIICLFCRNLIHLDTFEQPYGKMGFIYKDYFYKNSFKSSIRNEFNKIASKDNKEKNQIYSGIKITKEVDISIRILSCGHYFHQKCYEESHTGYIRCPVCEKIGNILIPPLTIFYSKEQYLKPFKLDSILNKNEDIKILETNKDTHLFKEMNIIFLSSIIEGGLPSEMTLKDFDEIENELFSNFEFYLNYVGNIFLSESTTFFKHEQLDNIQNVLLIIRYLINIKYIDIEQVINCIKEKINIIIKGPTEDDNVIEKYKKMDFSEIIDEIIFLFLSLTDYDEIKNLFAYIINWTLPYFTFWIYLRDLIIKNNFYSLYDEQIKEKIDINNFIQFLKENNKMINNYLVIFLQKLMMIKIISKFNTNKENLLININNLSMENLFDELNMQNLYKILPKDENYEINIIDIFEKLPNLITIENPLVVKEYIIFDTNKIFDLLINNIKKQKEEKYLLNPEFFYQFILYKFDFIELEDNLFEFIERSLFEKCAICKQIKKKTCVCLICGKKVCTEEIMHHTIRCTLSDNVFFDLQSMILFSYYNFGYFKIFDPIYTKEFNEAPSSNHITNEYNLNKEKVQLALKNYISRNFH